MNFIPQTIDQLKALDLKDGDKYTIEYMNKDYFNGEETLERSEATVIIDGDTISFLVPDPYGMDRFITKVRVV
jgi:molybdopterin converting factor small subunit